MTMYPSRNRGSASASLTSRLSPLSSQKRQPTTPPVARQAPVYPQQPTPSPAPQQQSENAQMKTTIPPDPVPPQQYTPPPMSVPGQDPGIFVNPNLPPQQTTPPVNTTPAPTPSPVEDAPPPEYPGTPPANPWDAWTPQNVVNAATISRFQYAMQNPAAMPAFYKSLGVMFADNPDIDWSQVATPAMANIIQRMAAGIGGGYNELRQFLQNQVMNLIANGGQQLPVEDAPAPEIPAQAGMQQQPIAPPPAPVGRGRPVSRYSVKTPGVSSGNGVYTGR